MSDPFNLIDDSSYKIWRERKIATAPRSFDELVIEVNNPRALTKAERAALIKRCQTANLAIYAGPDLGEDRTVIKLLGEQLGLYNLDHNPGADEDDITAIRVVKEDRLRSDFIPYTNRPLHWHTDGYYNSPERQIRGIILHCVRPAQEGGINRLIDHELVYLQLRDENPAYIAALSAPDAMIIPPNIQNNREIRPASIGPIFSVKNDGHLHLRYTARSRNIIWRNEPFIIKERIDGTLISDTKSAINALNRILNNDNNYILSGKLSAGQGIVCNNVLHDRSGFNDDPIMPRLIYRARYYDRITS